jgi:UDP-glucose-4-epimerase GalE
MNETFADSAVLVVGGAGYIGSHMVKLLAEQGRRSCVVDDFSTGWKEALATPAIEGPVQDPSIIDAAIAASSPTAAIHFASRIQVGESIGDPGQYYLHNVGHTICLLNAICKRGVKHFIFSSSAAVYGEPLQSAISEDHPTVPLNPYGRTKLMVEQMLPDYERAHGIKWVALRYFNAAGAHPDASIGERHSPETHLIPLALRAASGRLPHLAVYGTDYPTPDGTCVRDYIHVCDLASAHLLALQYLEGGGRSRALNLGNGNGYSVRQVIESVERVTGRKVPLAIGARRPGDPATLVADAEAARTTLGWKPRYGALDTIVEHAWAWEQKLCAMGAA